MRSITFSYTATKHKGAFTNRWSKLLAYFEDKRIVPQLIRRKLERGNKARLDLRAAPVFQNCLNENTWFTDVATVLNQYDSWVSARTSNKYDSNPDPAIVITETALPNNYISFCEKNVGIISAAGWKSFFRPASALEYLLTSVQRLSLRLSYGVIGSHYPTRGCLWDYEINVPDVRISAFLGFLCETCRNCLKKSVSPADYDEIIRLVENQWIGSKDAPSSVAGVLAKNYRYDLNRSTGLNPGFMTTITRSMQSEVGKAITDIVKWVVILLLTILVASYFPSISRFLGK